MPFLFNNCRSLDHVGLYGANAFYDLYTTGQQAKMATNLKCGDECIVAAYDSDGKIVFSWFSFSHESLLAAPYKPGTNVRVFFGKPIKSKYARRISCRLWTEGLGCTPAASSFARMKRSRGVRTHAASRTGGNSERRSGWNDQKRRASSGMVFDVQAGAAVFPLTSGAS